MPYLTPSVRLLTILSVLLLSCDPDEAKKKQPNTQDQDQDQDDNNEKNNDPTKPEPPPKPPKTIKATKLTRAQSTIPVVSLDAVGIDSGHPKDASSTVWVFQGEKITFSTTARDKDNNEIANAQFTWEWRKRGQDTDRGFGRTWTPIKGQTTATATLTIPAKERVGAYELRVSATSGSKTVDNHKETPYKFTVRKKEGCLAPSTINKPANRVKLGKLINGGTLTEKQLQAIDTSQVKVFTTLFYNKRNFNTDISCWDVSNVNNMVSTFQNSSKFNRDIGDWDTSKVTNMFSTFEGASMFNQDLSGWDVSKVQYKDSFGKDANSWAKTRPSFP